MTPEQYTVLKAAILADANLTTFVANGQDNAIRAYYNGAGVGSAWTSVERGDLYAAMTISIFDNLTAGKRDAWRLLMDYAPADFRKAKYRKAVTDIWGASEAQQILAACAVRGVTKAEALFGGSDKVESGVTAKVLNWEGTISDADIAASFGR